MKIILVILSVISFFSFHAFAGGYFRIDGMYLSDSSGSEGSTTNSSRTLIDIGAGHLFGNGFTLGGMYGSEKRNYSTYTLDRVGVGPTIGYMKSKTQGFYFLGTYFINPTMTGGYSGTGYQLDIGFRFALDKISIAPQFSRKHFKFTEQNDVALSPAYIDDRIDPYFVIWIAF